MVVSQILINKPREGVHKAGNAISGVVKYIVEEPTQYKEVTLSLLGIGKCYWSDSSSSYSGLDNFLTCHVNLKNTSLEGTITLHGEYEHPFEFYLPEDIPTSYKDRTASITYTIQLKFVKPKKLFSNKVFTAELPVYGGLNTTAPEANGHIESVIFGLEKTLLTFDAKKPVINLKAKISKTYFTPGENVNLYYDVTNDTNVTIPSINTELYCYTTYTADCKSKNRNCDKIKRCEAVTTHVSGSEVRHFSCILPTLPELYSIQHSKVISKEYKVRVTVRLPAPHINAWVEMPIVIVERTGGAEPDMGVETLDDSRHALPPSYWEVMCEDQVEEKGKLK